ncbi:MAG TPA: phosphopantetheine-binding protein [Streptosporangiaceae bacterium]
MSTSIEPKITPEAIRANVTDFVCRQTKSDVAADVDLFGSGLVSSLFALQLVVHVETAFGVSVTGPELKLDNFRTIDAIAELVLRLRGGRR